MNLDSIRRELHDRFGQGLERVDECLRILAGKQQPHYLHDEQEPTRIFFPGICAKPWHDPASFPWAAALKENWREIRSEFERLREHNVTFYPYQDQYTGDVGWPGWNTWHLYRKGVVNEQASSSCPKTIECLKLSGIGLREGLFSVLSPGAHLQAHTGGVNLVLTVHLPLIVPADCALKVAGQTRAWKEGKLFIFDDSFIHESWNHSSSLRVVLLWDVWHPELTETEVAALTYLFPHFEEFLTSN